MSYANIKEEMKYGVGIFEVTTQWDPGSIAVTSMAATSVTVTGASLGDFVQVSSDIDVADLQLMGNVTAANIVSLTLQNNGSAAVNLVSSNIYIRVTKRS